MGLLSPGESPSLVDKLRDYSPTFLDYRNRYHRSMVTMGGRLVCGDPKLDMSFHASEKHLNGLLEQYHALLGGLAFEEAVEGIVIPVEETEQTQLVEVRDGRGME